MDALTGRRLTVVAKVTKPAKLSPSGVKITDRKSLSLFFAPTSHTQNHRRATNLHSTPPNGISAISNKYKPKQKPHKTHDPVSNRGGKKDKGSEFSLSEFPFFSLPFYHHMLADVPTDDGGSLPPEPHRAAGFRATTRDSLDDEHCQQKGVQPRSYNRGTVSNNGAALATVKKEKPEGAPKQTRKATASVH
jgi:hypothetical protein